jgi:plasmid stabilization system protein ParE
MDFKVIFQETFLEDLKSTVELVAAHNPAAARKLGETIITTGEGLGFFPERHPRVSQRPGIRRFIIQKHFKIFYRVDHAARVVEFSDAGMEDAHLILRSRHLLISERRLLK